MREILFRGKRLDGIWEEGYYFAKPILNYHCILNGENQYQVDPTTLGQFTGLMDKNKVKIFKGDIVQIYNVYGERTNCHGVVLWSNHDQAYVVCKGNNKNIRYGDLGNYTDGQLLEAIGNIHDNPELMR